MVPLGVQWGNDPQADRPGIPLQENWNNPKAPLYATQTLGWGGRLSGPNDGGRNDIAVNGKPMPNTPNSSCMSCHSTAQWNNDIHRMPSFLLPSFATAEQPYFQTCGKDGKPVKGGTFICSPEPGSKAWMKWFQNRLGTQSMDEGSFATDFDEVFFLQGPGPLVGRDGSGEPVAARAVATAWSAGAIQPVHRRAVAGGSDDDREALTTDGAGRLSAPRPSSRPRRYPPAAAR